MSVVNAELATIVQRRRTRIARLQEEVDKTEQRVSYLNDKLLPRLKDELDKAVGEEEARIGEEPPVATPDGEPTPAAPEELPIPPLLSDATVRDAAVRLNVFTEPELAAVLQVPIKDVRKALPGLIERRIVRATGRRFHGKPMYEYVRPVTAGSAFEQQQALTAENGAQSSRGGGFQ
jgi:hypothetical protein